MNSDTHRNRIAVFDLLWFVPVALLAALDCYGRLPAIPGMLVPASAVGTLFLAAGGLVALRRLAQRFPCAATKISAIALWTLLAIDICVIVGALSMGHWLSRS